MILITIWQLRNFGKDSQYVKERRGILTQRDAEVRGLGEIT
jgi:hypothetical protein